MSDALAKQLLMWLTRLGVFAGWAHSVDARALMRMQALEIKVTCISRVLARIQALMIEVRKTYLLGIGEDTMVS